MKFNRFYNISPSASPSDEQVFYYKRIWFDNNENIPNKNKKPYSGNVSYPFYAIIKPYQIEFNYYGPLPANNANNSEYAEKEPHYQLYHRTLFSLTLSDNYNVNNKFAADLINLYDEVIDLSHLMQNKKAKILHIDDLDFENKNKKYFREYYHSYATIHQELIAKDDPYHRNIQHGKIPYRLLLLDFLFDFMEVEKRFSDFAYSSHLDEVAQRLLGNHFFFSIAAKYSYYYRKQILLDKLEAEGTTIKGLTSKIYHLKDIYLSNKNFDTIENILSRQRKLTPLMKKELEYSFSDDDFLKSDRIIQFFENRKDWTTRGKLRELIHSYFKTEFPEALQKDYGHSLFCVDKFYEAERKWLKALYKEDENIAINENNKWFENLEIENEKVFDIEGTKVNPFKSPLKWFRKQFSHSKTHKATRKLLEFSSYLRNSFQSFNSSEKNKTDESAEWHLSRYNIIKAFKLYSPSATFLINFLVIGVLILTAMQFVFFFMGETRAVFNNHLLIATIAGAVLFIGISLLAILKSVLIYLFSFFENRKAYRLSFHHKYLYRQNKFAARIVGFFMPKLFMAIISGWVILITAEELWKSLFDVKAQVAFYVAFTLLIILILFISVEIQRVKPAIPAKKVFSRTLVLVAFGIFYSSTIGLLVMSFGSERFLTRSQYLQDYYQGVISEGHNPQYMSVDPSDKQKIKDLLYNDADVDMVNDTLVLKLQWETNQITDSTEQELLLTFSNLNQKRIGDERIIPKDDKLYAYLDSLLFSENSTSNLVYNFANSPIPLLNKYDIKIFPGMLLIETIIALFIGVFLHLLLDRKKIVEPI